MESNRITLKQLGTVSLTASVILLFYLVVSPLNEANALFVGKFSTGNTNSGFTVPLTTNIASFGSKQWNLFEVITNQTLLTFNATNGFLLQNITLTPQINGNHKTPSGLDCTTTGAGGNGWCLATYTGGSGADRLFLIDITNTQVCGIGVSGASYNLNFLFNRGVMSGFDSLGATVHVFYWDSSGTNKIFYDSWSVPYNFVLIGGNQVPTTPKVCGIWDAPSQAPVAHVDTGLVGANPYDSFYTVVRNTTSGTSNNEIGWAINGINTFQIFNVGAQTSRCSVNAGANVFQVTYKQNPTTGAQNWYVSSSVGDWVKIYDNNCNLITTLTASTYDSASVNVRSVMVSAIRNEVYLYTNTGAGTGAILVVNATTPYKFITKIGVVGDAGAGTNRFAELLANPDNSVILDTDLGVSNSGTNAYNIVYWNVQGSSGGGPPPPTNNPCGAVDATNCVGSVNCELPQNAGLVMCVVNKQNVGNSQIAFNTNNNVMNQTGCVVAQAVGIIGNCNMKTNGVGYIFLAIGLLLINILWLLAVHSFTQRGIVMGQPIFIHALLSFAIIAAFTLVGWTDPTILIISIVAMIGFTAPKIVQMVRGGGQVTTAE